MTPGIERLKQKKLVGKRLTMSFANNRTGELWKSFIPRRKGISSALTNDMISVQVYTPTHFVDFIPTREFEKWATVEVGNFDKVPEDLETLIVTEGLYAVFPYKGLSTDTGIFQYIFGTWLPNSEFELDNRPHFEVLGDRYKNNDPASEEEIWIPIRPAKNRR